MRYLMVSTALAGLVFCAPALAQESDEEREVITVVSSPFETTTDNVVGSVDVVTDRDLQFDLNGNLADTLERLPGVTSSYFGPASGRPIVRGLGADRVRVLVNGLGALDASASSPDHAVSSEIIGAEAVEVLRGPAAIAFGGGAIGGVVNVIDGRIPERATEDGLDGYLYLGTTSVDDGNQLAGRVTGQISDLVLQFDYERREADPFDIPGEAESDILKAFEEAEGEAHEDDEENMGIVENSNLEFETFGGAVSIVGDWGFVGIGVKTSEGLYGLPGHGHEHEGEEGEEEEEEIISLDLDQTRTDLRGEVNLPFFYNRARWSLAYADYRHVELEGDEIGTQFDIEGLEGRFELRHRHEDQRQGALGLQLLTKDFASVGEEAYIEPVVTQDWGVFITERIEFDNWGLEGGLRAETRNLNGLRAERGYETVSGSLTAFFTPVDGWFSNITVSRSERAPTDAEVFANGPHLATETFEIGDLDLDTESAWSIEATMRRTFDRARLEATVFHASYDGFIELFPTGAEADELPVFEYRQEDAMLTGFEAMLEADLFSVSQIDFSTQLSLDYVQGELDNGGNLPRIPPMSGTAALIAETGWVRARTEVRWAGDQDDITNFELPTDGYTLVNFDLEYQPFADKDITILTGVRNLTDEEARLHTSFLKDLVPLPGRNVRLAIAARY